MDISQPPFEIQLDRTTHFGGMIKEKKIYSVIQRENVRGASISCQFRGRHIAIVCIYDFEHRINALQRHKIYQ